MRISAVGFNSFKARNREKFNIIYFNDIHAGTTNLDSFITARDKFTKSHNKDVNLTLSGGDLFLANAKHNDIIAEFVNKFVDASAVGNHDLAGGNSFAHILKSHNIDKKFLAANVIYDNETILKTCVRNSLILEKDNHRIGLIGLAPLDFKEHIFNSKNNEFINVKDFKDTLSSVKKEVENLESRGINKIILLAHTGNFSKNGEDYYKSLSKLGGIDVIVGGHDHIQVDKWETSSRNEPVKIVATGKTPKKLFSENLGEFGKLSLEFDENGTLIKNRCKNKIEKTADYKKSDFTKKLRKTKDLPIIYRLKTPIICDTPLTKENKIANLAADAQLWYVNNFTHTKKADFAFINAGAVRENFTNQELTESDISSALPFPSRIIKTELSKKQILDSLSVSAKSITLHKIVPGVMQVSNLKYRINKDLSVSDVKILNDDGTVKYDLRNFDANDTFPCVYDEFLATGLYGLNSLKKSEYQIEKFNATSADCLTAYLKSAHIKDFYKPRILKTN